MQENRKESMSRDIEKLGLHDFIEVTRSCVFKHEKTAALCDRYFATRKSFIGVQTLIGFARIDL